MKTTKYISAMLIALVFATASLQAQTARRPMQPEKEERAKAASTQVRKAPSQKAQSQQAHGQKAATPARSVNSQQAHGQKAATPARSVNSQQVHGQKAATPARNANSQQARQQQVATPARSTQAAAPGYKLSTPEKRSGNVTSASNTPATYRRSANNSYAEPRFSAPKHTAKYHNRAYYGGHYYHYAYPTTKVNIHYHRDTYLHHYNVLYYPTYTNIFWTRSMYRDYRVWYPDYHWTYNYGYRIQTVSVFDAKYNLGEVAMVYGRVYATWHNQETDDYLLFFGGEYPYQQFTVVLPGRVARRFSWRPERYFLGEHITTTGLITTFDGIPEIVVKHKSQIGIY